MSSRPLSVIWYSSRAPAAGLAVLRTFSRMPSYRRACSAAGTAGCAGTAVPGGELLEARCAVEALPENPAASTSRRRPAGCGRLSSCSLGSSCAPVSTTFTSLSCCRGRRGARFEKQPRRNCDAGGSHANRRNGRARHRRKNRGIGRAFVDSLLERGATTVYAAVRRPDAVKAADPRVVRVRLDVTDPARVAAIASELGDVQLVVNNAGIAHPGTPATASVEGARARARRQLLRSDGDDAGVRAGPCRERRRRTGQHPLGRVVGRSPGCPRTLRRRPPPGASATPPGSSWGGRARGSSASTSGTSTPTSLPGSTSRRSNPPPSPRRRSTQSRTGEPEALVDEVGTARQGRPQRRPPHALPPDQARIRSALRLGRRTTARIPVPADHQWGEMLGLHFNSACSGAGNSNAPQPPQQRACRGLTINETILRQRLVRGRTPTHTLDVGGTSFAYRQLARAGEPPSCSSTTSRRSWTTGIPA